MLLFIVYEQKNIFLFLRTNARIFIFFLAKRVKHRDRVRGERSRQRDRMTTLKSSQYTAYRLTVHSTLYVST